MRSLIVILLLSFSASAGDFQNKEELVNSVVIVKAVSIVKDGVVVSTTGTGFYIDNNTIITSYHVVENSNRIILENESNMVSIGTLIGRDKISDLAIVRTDRHGSPVILQPKAVNRRGDDILIIGHPRNFYFSFSRGIISHASRKQGNTVTGIPYIQTDAAINIGNSGSPVFNTDGHVIGMVQAIVTSSGGHEGISLIYPTKNIIDSIARINKASDRTARYNHIGVQTECIEATPERPIGNGARVTDVSPSSPAWRAGIRHNDIIIMLNMTLVDCKNDVYTIVSSTAPGNTIVGVLTRGDRRESFTVTIEEVSSF